MAKNDRFTIWLLILQLTVVGSAGAFDGKRTGFCLGFGAGPGAITYFDDGESDRKTLNGIQTTLDIGAGISDQLLILYSGHTMFCMTGDVNLVWGTPSVIVRFYFKPTSRSFYVFGGPAMAAGVAWDSYETGFGFGGHGVAVGGGYQFGQQFQVELGTVLTSATNNTTRTIHATVNLIGY